MASKDTNSTIFTVAVVAIGGFIAWKLFGGSKSAQAATVAAPGGGSDGGDYYAPYAPATDTTDNSLGTLIGGLIKALTGHGGSGGSLPGAGGPGAGFGGSASTDSGYGGATDFLNSLKEGLYPDGSGGYGVSGDQADPSLGGDSLYSTPGFYDPSLDNETIGNESTGILSVPGQDIGTGTDSSIPTDAPIEVSGIDNGPQIDSGIGDGGAASEDGGGYEYDG